MFIVFGIYSKSSVLVFFFSQYRASRKSTSIRKWRFEGQTIWSFFFHYIILPYVLTNIILIYYFLSAINYRVKIAIHMGEQ